LGRASGGTAGHTDHKPHAALQSALFRLLFGHPRAQKRADPRGSDPAYSRGRGYRGQFRVVSRGRAAHGAVAARRDGGVSQGRLSPFHQRPAVRRRKDRPGGQNGQRGREHRH